jgi:hypothetical protein
MHTGQPDQALSASCKEVVELYLCCAVLHCGVLAPQCDDRCAVLMSRCADVALC